MTKSTYLTLALVAMTSAATAQSGDWKLRGDSLTGNEKLGSRNNYPLDFISNNVKRMSLTNTGNLSFISDQSSLQFPNPGANPKPIAYLFQTATAQGRMVLAYSPSYPTYGLKYGPYDHFSFMGGSSNTVLDADLSGKRVGIGTSASKSKLHVVDGLSGAVPNPNSRVTIESSGANYLSILAPKNVEKGILFGHPGAPESGGIIYDHPATPSGLQFRTGAAMGGTGNLTRMVIDNFGRVGINTFSPLSTFEVRHLNDGWFREGLTIHHQTGSVDTYWRLYTSSYGELELHTNTKKGAFNGASGAYYSLSDERMKKDIDNAGNVLPKVLQLEVKQYHFLENSKDDKKNYGMLAQQVEQLFPEVVDHKKADDGKEDHYLMDYSAFGVIAIKAIQELVNTNTQKDSVLARQQQQIDDLQVQLNELKQLVAGHTPAGKAMLTDASLDQNIPNPFSNVTTIRFFLPKKFTGAHILITDATGKALKKININSYIGKGSVNVDTSLLSAGTYHYSLVLDERIVSTRSMVLAR